MLLGTFVDEVWWPSCGKLRECTRVGYESAYRCHIQPKWADVDMESITANDIEEWLGSFNQAGAARKAWAVLRAILRLAYRKGVTDNDVTRREIRLPHLRRYEPRVLDARQVRRLLKGFYGHALEAWLLVSVCAGLRRCESVGIEWADLDLRRGIVTVKRSVQWVAGVSGFRVAKHLHLPITHDKQAETAGRERYDALVGERTERFWEGLIRRRVVLLSTAVELDVAVDRDDASDAT